MKTATISNRDAEIIMTALKFARKHTADDDPELDAIIRLHEIIKKCDRINISTDG